MRIGIIGAGFTGLSASFHLQKLGHDVTIFEKEKFPGGLAIGFKEDDWTWPLEKHYHHIFTTDNAILDLAKNIGHEFFFTRPNTSSLIDGQIFQLDSPVKLMQFSKLSLIDRIRMGAVLGYLKYLSDWKNLEGVTAHVWLTKMLGRHAYEVVWEPLLRAKFGSYAHEISLAWFWARIKARSTKLGYPQGGFQTFADNLSKKIQDDGGLVKVNTTVKWINKITNGIELTFEHENNKSKTILDAVLVTVPNLYFASMADLPSEYTKKLRSFVSIGAVNMVLQLNKPFLPKDVYWLNISEKDYPFLAVVEHTNFIDKKHYGNHHLVYVGNYLPHGHRYFSMDKTSLLKEYDPFLKKLKPDYHKDLVATYLFKAPFAQPIVYAHFSKKILPFETPIPGVYLANMQQVYPWDRGTNFAVEMGKRVVPYIESQNKKK